MLPRVLVWALTCCLVGRASPPTAFGPPTVGIVLSFERQPSPRFFRQLRSDVDEIFRPTGLKLHWVRDTENSAKQTYDRAVVVKMRGQCDNRAIEEIQQRAETTVQLGATVVHDGEIVPFATVDCDRIARVARTLKTRLSSDLVRQQAYRRLAARVMAHELIHVLLKTPDHEDTDCARARLSPDDLLRNARLSKNEAARLREIGRAANRTELAERPGETSASKMQP